jgi:hypothetical protein
MNKKTIAIAALALFATSGLASARTLHQPKNAAPVAQTETYSAAAYDARNSMDDQDSLATPPSEYQAHPGDNDMDRYHSEINN